MLAHQRTVYWDVGFGALWRVSVGCVECDNGSVRILGRVIQKCRPDAPPMDAAYAGGIY